MGRSTAAVAGALLLGTALHALAVSAVAESADAAVTAPAAPAAAAKGGNERGSGASAFGDFSLRSQREPIAVRSDRLDFSYRDRLLTYSGNVVVSQGDLTLKADRLQVTINEEGPDRLQQIIATGGVEISQGSRSATGGKAVFDQKARTIELSEDAVLKEGPNTISGDRVTVYLDEERSVVQGGDRRVQALLYPGQDLGNVGRTAEATPR